MESQHQMLKLEDVQPPLHQVQSSPSSSSPSHEFSFAISLSKPSPAAFAAAIDLSPADEIFFHGHLLPLHLLSHLPVSPRSSTNSLDSFSLPIGNLHSKNDDSSSNNNKKIKENNNDDNDNDDDESRHVAEGKGRGKSKSFSLFALPKWGKERELGHNHDRLQSEKRKSRFDLLKRYVKFVKPLLSLRRREGSSGEFLRQKPYSFSGDIPVRKRAPPARGRRGELFSAPASMRTSPANSGLLVAPGSGAATPAGKSDSTMEELQAAIQAAIAHCKKSSAAVAAADDQSKLP